MTCLVAGGIGRSGGAEGAGAKSGGARQVEACVGRARRAGCDCSEAVRPGGQEIGQNLPAGNNDGRVRTEEVAGSVRSGTWAGEGPVWTGSRTGRVPGDRVTGAAVVEKDWGADGRRAATGVRFSKRAGWRQGKEPEAGRGSTDGAGRSVTGAGATRGRRNRLGLARAGASSAETSGRTGPCRDGCMAGCSGESFRR